jgi:hypothetical protein
VSAGERPSLIVYGNCQAEFLGLLLSRVPSITAHFDVAVASNNVPLDAALAAIQPYAHCAVAFWEQHDQRPEVTVREATRSRLPASCMTIRYPAVGIEAFWPFFFRDPRNQPEPGFALGRYPGGDRVAAEIAKLGLSSERAYERYLEVSSNRMPDLEMLVARDASVQGRRDAASDVPMADVVFANLRSTYQFWNRGHLAICLMSRLLERLLDCSSAVVGSMTAQMREELQEVYRVFPGQGEFQQPIHPLVIERLGLKFVDGATKYRWFGNSWTFEEFTKRYLCFDRNW